jgi:phosphoenolpyruvate carboxykinase (ATP)
VNTGWVGGPFGVGERMKLPYTRAMLDSALSGRLDGMKMEPDPVFRVLVPASCPGVPNDFLNARGLWGDKNAYDRAAQELSAKFNQNFKKFERVDKEVLEAAPGSLETATPHKA